MRGALGEALERYALDTVVIETFEQTTSAALEHGGVRALDPRRLGLYAPEQYAQLDFPYGPVDPDASRHWVIGRTVPGAEAVAVPAWSVFGHPALPVAEQYCQVSSNGVAAGPDLESAALGAALELIERDAFLVAWAAGRPVIELDGAPPRLEPEVAEVLRQYRFFGAEVHLLELDAAAAVPVVACLGFGDGERWPGLTVSLGAGVDLAGALRAAVLEQGQALRHQRFLSGRAPVPARPEEVIDPDGHARFYATTARAEAARVLLPPTPPVPPEHRVRPRVRGLDDLGTRLARAGLELVVVEVTPPDLGQSPLRVVRALIPGLVDLAFGHGLERRGAPRLAAALAGRPTSALPHPLA
jgi:ribosomal protein S12 methylthiotransferase accessory factor